MSAPDYGVVPPLLVCWHYCVLEALLGRQMQAEMAGVQCAGCTCRQALSLLDHCLILLVVWEEPCAVACGSCGARQKMSVKTLSQDGADIRVAGQALKVACFRRRRHAGQRLGVAVEGKRCYTHPSSDARCHGSKVQCSSSCTARQKRLSC